MAASSPVVKEQNLAMMPGESLKPVAVEEEPRKPGGTTSLPADYQDNLQPLSAANKVR